MLGFNPAGKMRKRGGKSIWMSKQACVRPLLWSVEVVKSLLEPKLSFSTGMLESQMMITF